MKPSKSIFWFRQDLRLRDNPGLFAAANAGLVLPIYIFDESEKEFVLGSASKWWLHQSLHKLDESLGNKLQVYIGESNSIILKLIQDFDINSVYLNKCYEPMRIKQQNELSELLKKHKVTYHATNGSLLWDPEPLVKSDNTPYKVFTPYYRNIQSLKLNPRKPLEVPKDIQFLTDKSNKTTIKDLNLMPKIKWYSSIEKSWIPGENGAQNQLKAFLDKGLAHYAHGRDIPSQRYTSRLSPYFHFGEISPNDVYYAVLEKKHKVAYPTEAIEKYISEMAWREFSYYVLYHFPYTTRGNFNSKFDKFPWLRGTDTLKAWQKGLTGIPIVDAGMRELWQTGWMHNRVRMIVGSFLVKNLGVHWHEGADWFWDTLVDADLASNSLGWQWVSGCGVDAAPYFRVFNPVTQGEKFDTEGQYVRKYVPELSALPNKYLHKPWEMPKKELSALGIELGKTYPKPLVDLAKSRDEALSAYANAYYSKGVKGSPSPKKHAE